jgi:hypothetical protein
MDRWLNRPWQQSRAVKAAGSTLTNSTTVTLKPKAVFSSTLFGKRAQSFTQPP